MVVSAVCLAPRAMAASGDQWLEDFAQARELSKTSNKPMLLDFTGSDWCPPCMQMDKQIFSSKKFQEFAKDNLVLMKVDFPVRKPQNVALQKQNAMLDQKLGVNQQYPTIVILSPEGKVLGAHLGFFYQGVDAFIQWIKDQTAA